VSWRIAVVTAVAIAATAVGVRAESQRTIAGSLQLDYLMVPTDAHARDSALDGMTAELSLKLNVDFTPSAAASVKVCFACHGFEAASAFVDLRASDELSVRIGRMLPEFGSFPQRVDPANHRSNDKPLPYDMGRMLHHTEWNEGILPAPWVDNGVELLGTRFIGGGRLDYAAYILSGPKGGADATDFDFVESREPRQYYVDNNSEPVVGARLSGTVELDAVGHAVTVGASVMTGRYDPQRNLGFVIAGADATVNLEPLVIRAEYLVRRTDMAVGTDPAMRWKFGPDAVGRYDDHFLKHGFYAEVEVPFAQFDVFARFDGLVRTGNVLLGSPLSRSAYLLRYTGGAAIRISDSVRLKASAEVYQSNDLGNDLALHLGVATPF